MMSRARLATAAIAAFAGCDNVASSIDAASCSTDDAGAPVPAVDLSMVAVADLAAPIPDLAPAPYPTGPYGNAVGDTIPPLVWEGYVDPAADALATTEPFGPYSMLALHRSGRAFGIVHVAEFY